MIQFTMIKEANPPQVKGTAAGVMNFLVFLTTGIMSPFVSHLMTPHILSQFFGADRLVTNNGASRQLLKSCRVK